MFLHYCAVIVGEDLERLPRLHPSSRTRLKAFALAMHIPVALWAVTSHAIATRIFGFSTREAVLVSVFCAGLIYVLERLILVVPRSRAVACLRIMIGLLVAMLAASTFDLVLFEKEIAASLKAGVEQKLAQEALARRTKAEAFVATAKHDWLQLQQQANCEANGTCGSGKASVGPIYRELSRQAELMRLEYLRATAELARLESEEAATLKSANTNIQQQAGLLERMEALLRYLQGKRHAQAFWLVLFSLVLTLEMVVILTKSAFHEETVDDQIARIKEDASRLQAQRYLKTLVNPAERARALLDREHSLR